MTVLWLILALLMLLSAVVFVVGLCSAAGFADSLDRHAIDHIAPPFLCDSDSDLGAKP